MPYPQVPKMRRCNGLQCGIWFMSTGAGNRKCPACTKKPGSTYVLTPVKVVDFLGLPAH